MGFQIFPEKNNKFGETLPSSIFISVTDEEYQQTCRKKVTLPTDLLGEKR
jgi:hypothetical protein